VLRILSKSVNQSVQAQLPPVGTIPEQDLTVLAHETNVPSFAFARQCAGVDIRIELFSPPRRMSYPMRMLDHDFARAFFRLKRSLWNAGGEEYECWTGTSA